MLFNLSRLEEYWNDQMRPCVHAFMFDATNQFLNPFEICEGIQFFAMFVCSRISIILFCRFSFLGDYIISVLEDKKILFASQRVSKTSHCSPIGVGICLVNYKYQVSVLSFEVGICLRSTISPGEEISSICLRSHITLQEEVSRYLSRREQVYRLMSILQEKEVGYCLVECK